MTERNWDFAGSVERLLQFREAREWERFHRPKELAAAIGIEAGELQELFLWRDPENAEEVKEDGERLDRISEEVADVAIFLLLLAHDLGIDLPAAVERKISSNEKRYTVEGHKGVAQKAGHPQ